MILIKPGDSADIPVEGGDILLKRLLRQNPVIFFATEETSAISSREVDFPQTLRVNYAKYL